MIYMDFRVALAPQDALDRWGSIYSLILLGEVSGSREPLRAHQTAS